MVRFYSLLLLLFCSVLAFGQNINTTFRSKMTFAGQTLANVWGYAAGGKEYALLGAAKGLIIVDISNPDQPQQIVQIPGPNNLWKEIKTYKHYAYVVSEGGMGVQVVDLSKLPASNLDYHFYKGDGAIANQLNTIHALHVDTTKGYLYCWGGNLFNGGAKVFNLNPDPYNPKYVGKFDQLGYIHDGFVDNDTMYAGHIYAGYFSIVSMVDKTNPELISTQSTPDNFTHNTWLSGDRKTLFTTDERNNSFLASFDVSDPENIRFLDKIQSNPGSLSIVHNTYILNDFAITSWYKDGFTLVDAARPDNLIQVGNFDTYPGAGSGFEGCWGVYPYLPSGTIIASNIEAQGTADGEVFFIAPKYVRGCYFEGSVKDAASKLPLFGAQIKVLNTSMLINTNLSGIFKGGQLNPGVFDVEITMPGYQPFTGTIELNTGELTQLHVVLYPLGSLKISGQVLKKTDQSPVAGAQVWLYGTNETWNSVTNALGQFNFQGVSPGEYSLAASEPNAGLLILNKLSLVRDSSLLLELYKNYRRGNSTGKKKAATYVMPAVPNPFSTSCTLYPQDPANIASIRVFDAQGVLVEDHAVHGESTLELGAAWPNGIYLLQILSVDGLLDTQKLIKNR